MVQVNQGDGFCSASAPTSILTTLAPRTITSCTATREGCKQRRVFGLSVQSRNGLRLSQTGSCCFMPPPTNACHPSNARHSPPTRLLCKPDTQRIPLELDAHAGIVSSLYSHPRESLTIEPIKKGKPAQKCTFGSQNAAETFLNKVEYSLSIKDMKPCHSNALKIRYTTERPRQMTRIDGIYTAYMTGSSGQGMAMFVFKDGKIAGADMSGLIFSGEYTVSDGSLIGEVIYKMPAGSTSITGASFEKPSDTIVVSLKLPEIIRSDETYRIETPIGPLNAKFVKNVGLGDFNGD